MFEDAIGSALGIETSAKLYISNLDYGVSNEDIKELFSEVGELKHYAIHYDRSGHSIGTADVVFVRRADAINALKRYNNVQLDGKPMKIELIGTGVFSPAIRGVYGGSSIGRGRVSGFIGRVTHALFTLYWGRGRKFWKKQTQSFDAEERNRALNTY
ncbi:hypothetical protein KP509_10G029600 [Ceratopteris richardii]|uniref:RRM domain-containing protein n=1 Tax=Ceratopteris richardii TaxID=49495 RepID=A0A8T2TZJ9_CERRI|nr:hypothetical protein KP509_10G029600 [Ceratopteris richardii]